MITKKTFYLLSLTFLYFLASYSIEFLILGADSSFFWCVSTNFFESINATLPIHCDEGPYRQASGSLEFFFSENNPYQKRPLYILLITSLRKLVSILTFGMISEYIEFRLAMIIVQYIILFLIGLNALKYFKIEKIDFKNILLLITLFSIPNIRWNLLFPSHGNITLLLFIYTLRKIADDKTFYTKSSFFILIGTASLFHRSAIIYGFVYIIIRSFNNKELNLFELFKNSFLIFLPTILYETIIYFSNYSSYDWNREVYGQFYWLIDLISGNNKIYHDMSCQQLETFLNCSWTVTRNYISYFAIGIFLFAFLIVFNSKKIFEMKFSNIFYVSLIIYVFWSFQGLYPNFRFVNYSLGYFIFFSLIHINYKYHRSILLSLSILTYEFSVYYLEPYFVTKLEPNFLTFSSVLLFFIFLVKLIYLRLSEKYENII